MAIVGFHILAVLIYSCGKGNRKTFLQSCILKIKQEGGRDLEGRSKQGGKSPGGAGHKLYCLRWVGVFYLRTSLMQPNMMCLRYIESNGSRRTLGYNAGASFY